MQHVSSDPLISGNSVFNLLIVLKFSFRSKAQTDKNPRVCYTLSKLKPELLEIESTVYQK